MAPDAPVDTALVEEALAATAPRAPLHVTFDWSLQEPDGRFSGQGVIRMEPPDRARLDLFGPRGEGYLTAVLDGEQLQIPASAQPLLPPPAFLWATLGVFREPARAQLVSAQRSGEQVQLGYRGANETWRFRLEQGRLRHVQWEGPDGGRRTVELRDTASHGLPRRAVYRDWLAFRELSLSVLTVETVDGFPADIWYPGER